ncbi:uncharacterized protein LOC141589927 [Silene latifolia]|uniref:uncharacterized protein LOC141589927 n=1 Tax=Silene latifolia TaxID=37657 RepID=UPI003D784471
MDRDWMFVDRLDPRYRNGVEHFVRLAINNAENVEEIHCPCVKCGNNVYTRWIWHGEDVLPTLSSNLEDDSDIEGDDFDENFDRVDDLINDLKQSTEDPTQVEMFDRLAGDAIKPLYPGSSLTRLSATLKLYSLKAKNGRSDKSFTSFLQLLSEILPDGNELPKRTYDAKKILYPMGVDYVKVHACPNDCILYRKDYKDLNECPKCGASRYKLPKKNSKKNIGVPAKVLWYLPIIPRFKRIFANLKDTKNLIWHAEGRISDDKIRHPADSTQWKTIDHLFPEFGSEARNLRLGLCTDGMNPFGSLSSQWSTWPLLWDEGVEVYDAYHGETFNLRAMIFCTINDFPAYGNLSGYTVKRAKACPICEEDTISDRLVHGGKNVYLCNRRLC